MLVALSKVAPQPSRSGVVVVCAMLKLTVWYQYALPLFQVSCSSLRKNAHALSARQAVLSHEPPCHSVKSPILATAHLPYKRTQIEQRYPL